MPVHEDILFEGDTSLEHYQVVERLYEGRPARVLFSGQRRSAQSGIGLDDDPDLLFDYNQRLLELANNLYPKRILVIGGGAFTLPMALVAALPDATVDVVELDEGLRPISQEYFGLRTNERLSLHFGDGRSYLAASSGDYDMIIIDVFSELSIPPQFLTLEFVQLLHSKLATGGSAAMNVIASIQGRNIGLIKSQIAAYQQTFAQLDIFPAAHGLTGWLPQNLILLAQRGPAQDASHFVRYAAIEPLASGVADLYHDQ